MSSVLNTVLHFPHNLGKAIDLSLLNTKRVSKENSQFCWTWAENVYNITNMENMKLKRRKTIFRTIDLLPDLHSVYYNLSYFVAKTTRQVIFESNVVLPTMVQ